MDKTETASPFIDTRRGGVHVREGGEVVVLPRIGGVQWSTTVESIPRVLEIMAPGVAVVLGVVLGPAEIAPASLWPMQAGFTKPAGTGPVTAVTGLTGPDRFRFRPVLNRPKFKF